MSGSNIPNIPNIPKVNVNLKLIVGAVALFLVVGSLSSAFYQVPSDSVAVVFRLGKVIQPPKPPGLHLKIPFGVDRMEIVAQERQLKLEFGYSTDEGRATNPYQFAQPSEQDRERDMVTGDLNSVDLAWVVQYRITDPIGYLINAELPELTLRDASESVMRQVVGDRTVDEVLTTGRADIEVDSYEMLKGLTDAYKLGLSITQVQLKEVNPPAQLGAAFQDVNAAQQEKRTKVNEANRQYKSAIPPARGKAEREIAEAEGYRTERVNRAEGDASLFELVYEQYTKAPEVTRQRIYLETMGEVLPGIPNKIIVDDESGQPLPLLNLGNKITP